MYGLTFFESFMLGNKNKIKEKTKSKKKKKKNAYWTTKGKNGASNLIAKEGKISAKRMAPVDRVLQCLGKYSGESFAKS